jgi:hypothetical protein
MTFFKMGKDRIVFSEDFQDEEGDSDYMIVSKYPDGTIFTIDDGYNCLIDNDNLPKLIEFLQSQLPKE